jgi:hypothetical protein
MKNTIGDLNNYLFESLERLMDDELSEEDLDREIKRSRAVTDVANALIHSGELSVKAAKHKTEYGKSAAIPQLLDGGKQ